MVPAAAVRKNIPSQFRLNEKFPLSNFFPSKKQLQTKANAIGSIRSTR